MNFNPKTISNSPYDAELEVDFCEKLVDTLVQPGAKLYDFRIGKTVGGVDKNLISASDPWFLANLF